MIVVGREDAVREPVSRMNCQTVSTGFSLGHFGGSNTRVMVRWAIQRVQLDLTRIPPL